MRIAVDLIGVSANGSAGGAAWFALELVRGLAKRCEILVLCNSYEQDYLAGILPGGIPIVPVIRREPRREAEEAEEAGLQRQGENEARPKGTGSGIRGGIAGTFRTLGRSAKEYLFIRKTLSHLTYDLLYCPFGVPTCYRRGIPLVATVLDLQHEFYPEFFPKEEIAARHKITGNLIRKAACLTSISDYTRRTFCGLYGYPEDKIHTIYIAIQDRFGDTDRKDQWEAGGKGQTKAEGNGEREAVSSDEGEGREKGLEETPDGNGLDSVRTIRNRLGLASGKYILYPANFWPHKNHERLFEAFAGYLQKTRDSQNRENRLPGKGARQEADPAGSYKLVLTGNEENRGGILRSKCQELGIRDRVVFAGHVSEDELGDLFRNAKGLIYPSLYEGFGIPVAEGMQMNLPVACSNTTSLPEVGGDAVFYFDPERVDGIISGIAYLFDTQVDDSLRERYARQLKKFSYDRMVEEYDKLFREIVGKKA